MEVSLYSCSSARREMVQKDHRYFAQNFRDDRAGVDEEALSQVEVQLASSEEPKEGQQCLRVKSSVDVWGIQEVANLIQ